MPPETALISPTYGHSSVAPLLGGHPFRLERLPGPGPGHSTPLVPLRPLWWLLLSLRGGFSPSVHPSNVSDLGGWPWELSHFTDLRANLTLFYGFGSHLDAEH